MAQVKNDSELNEIDVEDEYTKFCKLCGETFESIQEALKHDLLKHTNTARRKRKMRRRVTVIEQALSSEDCQKQRQDLMQALNDCNECQLIPTIIKYFKADDLQLTRAFGAIYRSILDAVRQRIKLKIYAYGSAAANLALKESDMDLFIEQITSDKTQQLNQQNSRESIIRSLNQVYGILRRNQNFKIISVIRQARVPIIKCKHVESDLNLDISFSSISSVTNTQFMRDLLAIDVRIYEVVFLLKIWAKRYGVIGNGTFTSYSFIMLIIYTLQQNVPNVGVIIPSMQEMQLNVPPNIILGVNYAYDMKNIKPIAENVTVFQLMKHFFAQMENFDFEKHVVSPYMSLAIPREKFIAEPNDNYKQQQQALSECYDKPAEHFNLLVNRCVCVQDIFCLTINVTKGLTLNSLEYICARFKNAHRICQTVTTVTPDAKFYDTLLFNQPIGLQKLFDGISHETKNKRPMVDNSNSTQIVQSNTQIMPPQLIHTITPSRAERHAISVKLASLEINGDIHIEKWMEKWVFCYKQALMHLLTEVYLLDVQNEIQLTQNSQLSTEVYLLYGDVDTWTGRLHVRQAGEDYLLSQQKQTQVMLLARKERDLIEKPLQGILHVEVPENNNSLMLKLLNKNNMSMSKNEPIRKFFGDLKVNLQALNLKEYIESKNVNLI